MNELTDVFQYALKHYPPFRTWERGVFEGWIRWHAGEGHIIRVIDDNNELAGLGIVRPVMKADDGNNRNACDPEGPVLFVDCVIATQPDAITAIGFAALKRFGMRETVAWKRPPQYNIEVHSARRLRKHLLRKALTHG